MDSASTHFQGTIKSVSLSSGEAEYYAGASAASDSILLQEAIKFLFLTRKSCKVHLYMDSSAARGSITRQGVGRVRHLQIRTLFLQDLHKQGTISVHPAGTKENTADIGTKPLSVKRIKPTFALVRFSNWRRRTGRKRRTQGTQVPSASQSGR